jgi:putative cardiolipin synthase
MVISLDSAPHSRRIAHHESLLSFLHMRNCRLLSIWIAMCLGSLLLTACATRLESLSLPPESTPDPSQSQLWQDLQSVRSDEWSYLLNDGATALDWRLRAIDSATESIAFQTFLWDIDTVGQAIERHLLDAADSGVRVRILVDDTFLLGDNAASEALQAHPNIEYRIYNPFKRRSDRFVSRQILNLAEFHRLDHRMHNKVMVVDNRVAIVGGRNIADEYFGLHESANFRDIELLVGGTVVQKISDGFDLYWNDEWSFPVDVLNGSPTRGSDLDSLRGLSSLDEDLHREESIETRSVMWRKIVGHAISGQPRVLLDEPAVGNPASKENAPVQLSTDIVDLVDSAKQEIRIVSAYLIPTVEFESAIERAESRGVEVHILTNSIRSNNHVTAHSAYRKHIRELLDKGADVHEVRVDAKDRATYMQSPLEDKTLGLHAKLMLVDKAKVFIGSANFDPRSLRLNTETGLLIHSEELAQQVHDAISVDFLPRNSWHLRIAESGQVQWVSDDQKLDHLPTHSFMLSIEDWFFARLPIEGEM